VLTGIIVFVLVPLLGLLAYWLVFLRRARLAREDIAAGAPGCAPPAGEVAPIMRRAAAALPLLRFLPLAVVAVLGATLTASTPMSVILKAQAYWIARRDYTRAVVPYISDTGADAPSYFVFAVGLNVGAALMLATFRLVYERMDPLLAAADAADGRYGRQGEARCADGDEECGGAAKSQAEEDTSLALCAPEQAADMTADGGAVDAAPASSSPGCNGDATCEPAANGAATDVAAANGAAAPADDTPPPSPPSLSPCWCSTGRYLHCCCCCSQSLRQQGRSAYICGATIASGLPLLTWCSVSIQVLVHSFGAAATFLCAYLHLMLLARLAAARVAAAARHPGVRELRLTPADERSASIKATCVWSVPVAATAAFIVVLPACGDSAGAVWNAFLAPLLEWGYVGMLAVYFISLCHEVRDAVPPARRISAVTESACVYDARTSSS
jgi:hypothetical protein